MSTLAISADRIGKRYFRPSVSHVTPPDTLVGEVLDTVRSFIKRGGRPEARDEEFWALKDVSFEVQTGERVGIIGANGSGKSTLLKVLSRITAPSEGEARLRGRVASLLEVGTGFHQELTGRENVYLNGAILGLSHAAIKKIFDAIVEFSGVEAFIDTPIKHYSSGMQVRLAFAVAAHLEPDILIIDEVLAVGDAAFQKKCLARMNESVRDGRTILFVSHGLGAVSSLCDRAVFLEKGRVMSVGDVKRVIFDYETSVEDVKAAEPEAWPRAVFADENLGDEFATCLGGTVETLDGSPSAELPIDQPFRISMRYRLNRDCPFPVVPRFSIFDGSAHHIMVSMPSEVGPAEAGDYVASCIINPYFLNAGRFSVGLAFNNLSQPGSFCFDAEHALRFEIVEPAGVDPRRHGFSGEVPGFTRARLDWTYKRS